MSPRVRGLSAVIGLVVASSGLPQSRDERAVRAAYVFNIVKLVDWPAERNKLLIGFLGNRETGEVLRKMLDGKASESRSIDFILFPSDDELLRCNIVYFASVPNAKTHAVLTRLEGKNVWTIGEADSFVRDGGTIGLAKVGDQIRIQINLEAARRAEVNLNPRLLRIADIVPSTSSPEPEHTQRRVVRRLNPAYPSIAANMSLRGTVKLKVSLRPMVQSGALNA